MQQSSIAFSMPLMATNIGEGSISTTLMSRLRSPVRQIFAPPSISKQEVRLTCTNDEPSLLRPNTLGAPTTLVTLSMTKGKSGSCASRVVEGPTVGVGGGRDGVHGNSKGHVGERGWVGPWTMWSMREPAGRAGEAGGGSAGGWSGATGAGGGSAGG